MLLRLLSSEITLPTDVLLWWINVAISVYTIAVFCAESRDATHDVLRTPTSHFADVTSSSPTVDHDADSISVVNEFTSNTHCANCDCTSHTGSRSPTSVTSSNSGGDSGALYRPPLQHTLLSTQQRKKRSRAAFSHAQAITSCYC